MKERAIQAVAVWLAGGILRWLERRAKRRKKPVVPSGFIRSSETAFTAKLVTHYFPAPCSIVREKGLSCSIEGGSLDAHGNTIWNRTTLEDFRAGRGDYVTVAMDPERRDLQGMYLRSPVFPGILFRVMDVGGFGRGRGTDWVDIATSNAEKARTETLRDIAFYVFRSPEIIPVKAK